MKRVTATQARKQWFQLLDEALRGETVVVVRGGERIVMHREEAAEQPKGEELPDYGPWLDGVDLRDADRWQWRWDPDESLELSRSSSQDDRP